AQKSEVHATTGDASTNPVAQSERQSTQNAGAAGQSQTPKRDFVAPADIRVERDDTDDGGPLIIKSSDPDLQKLDLPIDPFPTERKPEIDPPVERK
ncbi:MAG TPA: hypothetical protein VGB55_04920, partial [Tepidisphaeraceae bacterium]